MILELVACDSCFNTLLSPVVPRSWITFSGKHYCSPSCMQQVIGGDE